jgi:hypothetical protein
MIAATDVELSAAEAIATEARQRGVQDFTTLHEVCDANTVLHDHMAARGMDALAELPAANRVAATVDVLLAPEVDTHDEDGGPLACADCGRRMAYDYRRESYRHLIEPRRGCFLIPAEAGPGPEQPAGDETAAARLDRLASQPQRRPERPGIDL